MQKLQISSSKNGSVMSVGTNQDTICLSFHILLSLQVIIKYNSVEISGVGQYNISSHIFSTNFHNLVIFQAMTLKFCIEAHINHVLYE